MFLATKPSCSVFKNYLIRKDKLLDGCKVSISTLTVRTSQAMYTVESCKCKVQVSKQFVSGWIFDVMC